MSGTESGPNPGAGAPQTPTSTPSGPSVPATPATPGQGGTSSPVQVVPISWPISVIRETTPPNPSRPHVEKRG